MNDQPRYGVDPYSTGEQEAAVTEDYASTCSRSPPPRGRATA